MGGWASLQCWGRQENHKNTVSGFPLESTFHSATLLDERKKRFGGKNPAKLFMCVSFPLVALREWRRLCCRVKGEVAFPETFVPGNGQFQHPQIWAPGEAQTEIQRGIK